MIDQTPEALARKHLENTFAPFRKANAQRRPPRGWVRAIRDALGMTSRQLAARMGHSQSTVTALEQSEASERISLKTLRQAAAALDCELVYALVPRTSLDGMVYTRAVAIADQSLARIHHTMRLEDQALQKSDLAVQRERLIQNALEGRPSRLWETL